MSGKDDQTIMVVRKDRLFEKKYFQGYLPCDETNIKEQIDKHHEWMRRGDAETNEHYKQPIGYHVIVNPAEQTVLVFQRAKKDKEYFEKRLQGKWAIGVGGHVEKFDARDGNPYDRGALREVKEEIFLPENVKHRIIGYINNDSNSVGRVHIGVLTVIETDASEIKAREPEIQNANMLRITELVKMSEERDFEEWSRIAILPILEYLSQDSLST